MNTSKMQYLNSVFILAAVLCGAVTATPPALAETCMTDDLMMVYEPIEPARTQPKRPKKRATNAHVRLASEKNAKVAAVSNAKVESSMFATSKKHSEQADFKSNGSNSRETAKPIRVSSVESNQVGRMANQKSIDLWNGTQISHVDVAER
jgi:FlaG/FlaF family flagellin (archaellin)